MSDKEREYKTVQGFTKAAEGRVVEGFLAITGNVDSGDDRILPGAFVKTIAENAMRVKHLWMHNPYEPPTAKILDLKEVSAAELPEALKAQFPEAMGGLYVKREYLNTPRGDEVLAGIKAGAITEGSIGYDPIKFDYEKRDAGTVRNLREVRLWDTSDVTWGMNPATMNLKSIDLLTQQLKDGRVLSTANLEKLKSALATLTEILNVAEPQTDAQTSKSALTSLRLRQEQLSRLNLI